MLNKKLTFSSVFSARAVAALYSASSWSARASAFSVSVWRKGAHLSQFKVQGGGALIYMLWQRDLKSKRRLILISLSVITRFGYFLNFFITLPKCPNCILVEFAFIKRCNIFIKKNMTRLFFGSYLLSGSNFGIIIENQMFRKNYFENVFSHYAKIWPRKKI